VCDEFDWCLGYQIYYSEIRLITDYPTYHKALRTYTEPPRADLEP